MQITNKNFRLFFFRDYCNLSNWDIVNKQNFQINDLANKDCKRVLEICTSPPLIPGLQV